MIGELPQTLEIGGEIFRIRTDFKIILNIFQAYNDVELTLQEKIEILLTCLFEEPEKIHNYEETMEKADMFLNGGMKSQQKASTIKKFDWEQDEQIIFSAINKVAGFEVRNKKYMHWWTFLGLFREMNESLFNNIVNIREKKNKGKKLDKGELEFYRNNKDIVDIKLRYSKEEQEEIDRINKILG